MDELKNGWEDYWKAYKKIHYVSYKSEEQPIIQPIIQDKIEDKKIETINKLSKSIGPSTISIIKERKIIHIKL
tara:strand:- start:942 stop:1160 length:219 start_codon:yes stop_codon:yes gene_type:complete